VTTPGSMAAIAGVGELRPVRDSGDRTTLEMITEVSRLAVADAGLEPAAIDGLLVGPMVGETPMHVPATVGEYLGMSLRFANVVDLGGASAIGMVWRAAAAIREGVCEAVLCVLANTLTETRPRSPNRNPIREFDVPFGASGANVNYAMIKQRHLSQWGSREEDFAEIVVRERDNAQRHPDSIFHGKPVSREEVLSSPMIASPLRLLEIVMPVAGGDAVVVIAADRIAPAAHGMVKVLGAAEQITHRALSQAPELTSGPLKPAIARALARAGCAAEDLDLLSLYDCYSVLVAITIEDIGLCPPGQFGAWMAEHDFGPDGDFPLNTHGGQLGFGQPDLAGGMTHIVEAVRQLRGDAAGRQIRDAGRALVTGNGATMGEATALVLGAA